MLDNETDTYTTDSTQNVTDKNDYNNSNSYTQEEFEGFWVIVRQIMFPCSALIS